MTSIARVSAIDLATVYEEFERDDVKYLTMLSSLL